MRSVDVVLDEFNVDYLHLGNNENNNKKYKKKGFLGKYNYLNHKL